MAPGRRRRSAGRQKLSAIATEMVPRPAVNGSVRGIKATSEPREAGAACSCLRSPPAPAASGSAMGECGQLARLESGAAVVALEFSATSGSALAMSGNLDDSVIVTMRTKSSVNTGEVEQVRDCLADRGEALKIPRWFEPFLGPLLYPRRPIRRNCGASPDGAASRIPSTKMGRVQLVSGISNQKS
jgi:hypothetical protein